MKKAICSLFSGNATKNAAVIVTLSMIALAHLAIGATPVTPMTGINVSTISLTPPGTGTALTRANTPATLNQQPNLTAAKQNAIATDQINAYIGATANPQTTLAPAAPNPAISTMTANTAYNGVGSAQNIVDDPFNAGAANVNAGSINNPATVVGQEVAKKSDPVFNRF